MAGSGINSMRDRRRDQFVVGLALLSTTLGLALGWNLAAVASVAMALPIVGFVLSGHVSGRGAVVGCIVLTLGATLVPVSPGVVPWLELGVLTAVVSVAMLGASWADALVPQPLAAESLPSSGGWMTVIVEGCEPDSLVRRKAPSPDMPNRDPERRSRSRLAGERSREPVAVGAEEEY